MEKVLIEKDVLIELIKDSNLLSELQSELQSGRVDNWDWYGEAASSAEESEEAYVNWYLEKHCVVA